jgi:hypothetical protein
MAVAGHVFDGEPAPPWLARAWDYQTFGINVLDLPAGELQACRLAQNAHRAMSGYKHAAGKTVPWSKANPEAWAFVASVLEERLRLRKVKRTEDG